ncbi:hypothetical protein [Limibacillus halophilus]|uniref:Uncharacterized protein n=1 Tax=Limibacillus halophilus TaxID=1579333 RepID=A0A839T027_9PROT|nr:hypothetical protein [Limibacillus halophilus]MBB3066655.1 hypothetical protein [Limibacillus halophilus]
MKYIVDYYNDTLISIINLREQCDSVLEIPGLSPWLAMSLLQKAIRRGRVDLALCAARALYRKSPDRLWRRLAVIAFEDVGLADIDAVGLVLAGLSGRKRWARIGGEWAVVSYLTLHLARACKCRATDDLVIVADWHLDLEDVRLSMTYQPFRTLIEHLRSDAPLESRAVALRYCLGTDRFPSFNMRPRKGDPKALFECFENSQVPMTVVALASEGFKKGAGLLAPHLMLLWQERSARSLACMADELPEETQISGIPSWCFDMHVREGNRAFARFLEADCRTARWIAQHVPKDERVAYLAGIAFRHEASLVNRRLQWGAGYRIRKMADLGCSGAGIRDCSEVLHLLGEDHALLNQVRRSVCVPNSR